MTGCLECPLASSVFAQSWSQTATDGAWYSTTALPSGRDRPRCLCVLRLSGSEPKTRRTGSVAASLPSNSLLVARVGNVELDRYPQLMLPGAETRVGGPLAGWTGPQAYSTPYASNGIKMVRKAASASPTIISVSARRSVDLDDDKVVSEYEEDWPEGGIGSAIRVSCPSYLGPSWQVTIHMHCFN